MRDFAKFFAAGGILAILIVYGGFGDPGAVPDKDQTPMQVSGVSAIGDALVIASDHLATELKPATAREVPIAKKSQKAATTTTATRAKADPPKKKVITMRFVVFFDFDSARVSSRSQRVLQQAIDYAKAIKPTHVQLAGFADRAGPAGYNMKLSEKRANMVAAVLKGVDVETQRLDVRAFGEQSPAVQTPDGMAEKRNRRVEIVISA